MGQSHMDTVTTGSPGACRSGVSVIIPVYNEEGTIGNLVAEITRLYPDYEIIVVDDGSTDRSAAEAAAGGARVLSHPYNIGNGAAVKTGVRVARGDIMVFMDGDGQHDPGDIGKMIELFPRYDMVVGARSALNQASLGRALGNKAYNLFASYVAKFNVQDLTSGFRAVKSEIARELEYLFPNTYSYPTTLTLAALRSGRSVAYVPVRMMPRGEGTSEIHLVRDGVRFFMIILRICTLYSPMRVFLPVSFLMFLLGVARYAYSYIAEGRFTNMSALLFITSVLIFMMGLISEQICQMRFERSRRDQAPGADDKPIS